MELLFAFFQGYVVLSVNCSNRELLLNNATARGLKMWNVRSLGREKLLLSLSLRDFWLFREICRELRCTFRVTGKKGLPFYWKRLIKRKMLLAGVGVFALLMFFLGNFIWMVSIISEKPLQRIDAAELIEAVREYGIAVGAAKNGIEPHRIEDEILGDFPELGWVGIEIRGIKAEITVAEKVFPREEQLDKSPGDLVAAKAGVVEEILVFNGQASVARGDTVREGQVLIAGMPVPPVVEETKEDTMARPLPQQVRAKGIVRAKVWYEAVETIPLRQVEQRLTGRKKSTWMLRFPDGEVKLLGPKAPPFQDYQTEQKVNSLLNWRNPVLTVELVKTSYQELKRTVKQLNFQEAQELAAERTLRSINEKSAGRVKILDKKTAVMAENNQEIQVRVVIESLEDITRRRSFK